MLFLFEFSLWLTFTGEASNITLSDKSIKASKHACINADKYKSKNSII